VDEDRPRSVPSGRTSEEGYAVTRKKKPPASLVRSSAAEYLTFVAASGGGGVAAVYTDSELEAMT
jgi:hypothetical protein